MALTSIGQRRTPSVPIEETLDAELGLPSDLNVVCVVGHRGAGAASGSSGVANYEVIEISNVADVELAQEEAEADFGVGSEIAKMIVAAVAANEGQSTVPRIKACALASTDTGFGAADEALTAIKRQQNEFVVSPYDGVDQPTLRTKLNATVEVMSGPDRGPNNQFGSFGVVFNRNVSDPSTLPTPDSRYLLCQWFPDSGTGLNAPAYSIGEACAALAARMASNGIPFNPQTDETIPGMTAPAKISDWITVGAGLESEVALQKGWAPIRVLPNGDVAFVRTVTSRITTDGLTPANAYFDLQDFQVINFFRKALYTNYRQPNWKQRKASPSAAKLMLGDNIRIAKIFETEGMFQRVNQLASQFKVERNISDRSRFDNLIPINVVPGLYVIAINVKAGTQFDDLGTVTT